MGYGVQYGSHAQDRGLHAYIFVVSHMRSFSSLLCHILGSHAEIEGYAETHQSYSSRNDLHRLTRRVHHTTGDPVVGRYVLDKILDEDQYLAPSVLGRSNVRVLLLVRNPEDTISSILNLSRARGHTGRYSDPEGVLDYYTTRLQQIDSYSAQLGRNALFLESERLIDETDAVLDSLSQWLSLDAPLSANYRTFKFSGVAGYCDPSPHIMAGSIIKDADDRHRGDVPMAIPEEILRRGRQAYAACRESLSKRNHRP